MEKTFTITGTVTRPIDITQGPFIQAIENKYYDWLHRIRDKIQAHPNLDEVRMKMTEVDEYFAACKPSFRQCVIKECKLIQVHKSIIGPLFTTEWEVTIKHNKNIAVFH